MEGQDDRGGAVFRVVWVRMSAASALCVHEPADLLQLAMRFGGLCPFLLCPPFSQCFSHARIAVEEKRRGLARSQDMSVATARASELQSETRSSFNQQGHLPPMVSLTLTELFRVITFVVLSLMCMPTVVLTTSHDSKITSVVLSLIPKPP